MQYWPTLALYSSARSCSKLWRSPNPDIERRGNGLSSTHGCEDEALAARGEIQVNGGADGFARDLAASRVDDIGDRVVPRRRDDEVRFYETGETSCQSV